MKLTVRKIVESAPAIREIERLKISPRLSFTLGVVINALMPFWKRFDEETAKAMSDLGAKNVEGTNNFNFDSIESAKLYRERLDDLLDVEVSVPIPGRIPLKALEDEGVKLSGGDSALLDWLIKVHPDEVLFLKEKEDD